MPFKSKQQAKFMYSQHPEIVEKWKGEGVNLDYKNKPKRVKGSKSTPAKTRKAATKQKNKVQSRKKGGR